ncbi:hypothetical protein SNE25_11960 [Mucilaginibacter sabulilitoris]|uniref:Uncharacterized protein n=1 Tax=Mucilaginibacter sabulilitoris TaxID=1173583 RepID=A0ABZ0TVR9_9SPHI|nr:hypothetical protein [Mucilaginibacter sabulilitoris]WPU96233.1 hypothetical protein SNE25_11960 [Mucilaginibacter sabulilitoris]
MRYSETLRRSFIKKALLFIPALAFFKHQANAEKIGNFENLDDFSSDSLTEKLNDIDALTSECYSRLQDNSILFKNVADTKNKIADLQKSLDICNSETGGPDDIKSILDNLKAIKELVSIHS